LLDKVIGLEEETPIEATFAAQQLQNPQAQVKNKQ
jgi:hypothetical protein